MIVTGYINTGRVGSETTFEVEIPDEDLEGLTEEEREGYISQLVRDETWNYAEWGWHE